MKLLLARWLPPFRSALAEAVGASAAGFDAQTLLGPAKDPKHGALSSGVALRLAGALREKPPDLAERIAEACRRRAAEFPDLLRVDVAPPGYVNFRAAPAFYGWLAAHLLREGHSFGRSSVGRGESVSLEFCSANPTGPLTVAHGRQAAVGDCLANILAFAGFEVTREYYWNDTGGQIDRLVASVRTRGIELEAGATVFQPLPEGLYQGEYVIELARTLLREKGKELVLAPDPAPLRREVVACVRAWILDDLAALGVRYEAQTSQEALERSGRVAALIEEFGRRGLLRDDAGARWFKAKEFGDTQDWVLVKSDGSFTYRAPDYAYHRDKFERGFGRVIDLLGPDHHAYAGSLRAGLRAMHAKWADAFRVRLVQFCKMVRGQEEVKMSKRGGTFVTLREVIDEVGPDATRFFFVLRRIDSHLTFDLELAKAQKSENPVYYVQYAHARIASVLRKAREEFGSVPSSDDAPPPGEEECALLQVAGRFPDAVERAAEELEPYVVTEYLQLLAGAFQRYYQHGDKDESFRILHADERLRSARLAAARGVQVVLRNGLALLGVAAPERMDP